MKWVGYRLVSVASIDFDAKDLEARSKQPHVVELAASIQALGDEPMQPPVVSDRDGINRYRLVAGRDRLAAWRYVLGRDELWVHIGEDFTDRELLVAEVHENTQRRRDDRNALLARLVETAEVAQAGQPVKAQTAKARARAQVAKETGLTHKAVTHAEQRAKAKVSGAAAEHPPGAGGATPSPPPLPILTFGLPLPPEQAEALRAECKLIDAADAGMRQAVAGLAKAMEALSGVYRGRLAAGAAALVDSARALGAEVRAARPTVLCYFCKGIEALSMNCPACRGARVLTEGQTVGMDIPPELTWSEGERPPAGYKSASGKGGAHVAIDGKFVPIAQASKVTVLDARPAAALPSAEGKAPKANGAAAEREGAARPASVTRSRGPAGSPPNGRTHQLRKRVMRAIMPDGEEVVVPPPDEGPVRVYDEPGDDEGPVRVYDEPGDEDLF